MNWLPGDIVTATVPVAIHLPVVILLETARDILRREAMAHQVEVGVIDVSIIGGHAVARSVVRAT
jgi:hypothetical protein